MFTSELEDGLAQLAHYYEYFATPENCSYVRDFHGIVVEQPSLYLIAGNQFNTKPSEVREALRRVNLTDERFHVISYDALVLSYTHR